MRPATRKALRNLADNLPSGFDPDEDQFVVDELQIQRVWIFDSSSIGLTHDEAFDAIRFLRESGIFAEKFEDAPAIEPLKPMNQDDRWLVDVELLRKTLNS